jgi:hypothetical protein
MDAQSETLLRGVQPELADRIRQMEAVLSSQGIKIKVVSGLRSTERQKQLYAARASNPYPVAVPGTSLHEKGRAVDVGVIGKASATTWNIVGSVGKQLGLRWGGDFRKPDPVHFELTAAPVVQVANNNQPVQQIPESHRADYVLDHPNLWLYGFALFAFALVSARQQ